MTFSNLEIQTVKKCKLNTEIPAPNHVTLETRSLWSYGPKKLNALPYHIKTS